MRDEIKNALEQVSSWVRAASWSPEIDGAYVFGTIVHRNAIAFGPESDVDIAIVAKPSAVDNCGLFRLTSMIRSSISSIEGELIQTLRRSADTAICSISIIGSVDAYHSIHKGHDINLLSADRFVDVKDINTEKILFSSIARAVDEPQFYRDNADTISAIEFAQTVRNEFLHCSFNGRSTKLQDWSGSEPIPKRIMRQAAILGWKHLDEDPIRREDPNVGLRYINAIFQDICGIKNYHTDRLKQLRDKIEDRSTRRGSQFPSISPEDQVLLAEILYADALSKLIPSTRQLLDGVSSFAAASAQA